MHEESTHKVVYLSDDRSALEKAGDDAGRAGDRRDGICVQGNRLIVCFYVGEVWEKLMEIR